MASSSSSGEQAGLRLVEQALQRRPHPGAATQGQEQLGLGGVTEAGHHQGRSHPQVGRIDHEARVDGAGELEHRGEPTIGAFRQFEPQAGAGRGAGHRRGDLREPRLERAHVVALPAGVGGMAARSAGGGGAHHGVGDGVEVVGDEAGRVADAQRSRTFDGQCVGARGEGGRQRGDPALIVGRERTDAPCVDAGAR